MNEDLKVSSKGLEFITNEEGVVLHVYLDQVKLETIGVGHLLTPSDKASGRFKNGITREQAIDLLKVDVVATENTIKKFISIKLNQNQFDALASMLFNTGPAPVSTGTLGKLINAGKFDEVPAEMAKWCHAGGKILPILQARRIREAKFFSLPMPSIDISAVVISNPNPMPIIHPAVPMPDHEPTLPEQDQTLTLSPWQKILGSIAGLFGKK